VKTYQVGFSFKVSDGEQQTAHRVSVPVDGLSAEHAAKSLAYALGVLAKDANTKPADEAAKTHPAPKGGGK
jgi:hypothetical protein